MSRLFAAILIRSSKVTGSRSEIDVVEGFKLGNRARRALLQSIWSEESRVSQKRRSCASLRKAGIGLGFLLIALPFLTVHVACGNHPDEPAFAA